MVYRRQGKQTQRLLNLEAVGGGDLVPWKGQSLWAGRAEARQRVTFHLVRFQSW